jgi:hypothetical protein
MWYRTALGVLLFVVGIGFPVVAWRHFHAPMLWQMLSILLGSFLAFFGTSIVWRANHVSWKNRSFHPNWMDFTSH